MDICQQNYAKDSIIPNGQVFSFLCCVLKIDIFVGFCFLFLFSCFGVVCLFRLLCLTYTDLETFAVMHIKFHIFLTIYPHCSLSQCLSFRGVLRFIICGCYNICIWQKPIVYTWPLKQTAFTAYFKNWNWFFFLVMRFPIILNFPSHFLDVAYSFILLLNSWNITEYFRMYCIEGNTHFILWKIYVSCYRLCLPWILSNLAYIKNLSYKKKKKKK